MYCRGSNNPSLIEEHVNIQPLLENDDNWIADHIEHPDNYNEEHYLISTSRYHCTCYLWKC